MRLLGIILGTLFAVNMALASVYFWGLGRVFPKYNHPFFAEKTPWIILPLSWTEELSKYPNTIIWLNIFKEKNQTLSVLSENKDPGKNLALSEVLNKVGNRRVIFNIISNVEDIDRQMLAFIKDSGKSEQILVQSDFDIILRAMKDQDANHPYGSSQSDRLRFNTFKGMALWSNGLLPATPFKGDVYISPLKWKNISLINEQIRNELRRRQKFIILGPLTNKEEVNQAESLNPDGFYFGKKEALEFFVHSHPGLSESVAH
jgi:hypothetical protein